MVSGRRLRLSLFSDSFEITIDCPDGRFNESVMRIMRDRFHTEHDRTYGHGYPDEPTELVNFRLTAVGQIAKPSLRERPAAAGDVGQAVKGSRQVYFAKRGGFVATAVYDRLKLTAGHRFSGPALLEEMDSTTLVLPEFKVEVDRWGNLLISPR